jgi:hypothetical protein
MPCPVDVAALGETDHLPNIASLIMKRHSIQGVLVVHTFISVLIPAHTDGQW